MKRTFGAAFYYWRMALLRVTGKAIMAGIVSMAATLNGVEWSEFNPTERFVAIATGLGAMWLVVDAFLDQSMSRLQPQVFAIPPDATLVEQKVVSKSGTTFVEAREEKPVASQPETRDG